MREVTGEPVHDRLASHLRKRKALLVLDNFEHVLLAAPFVPELISSCPGLKIRMTAREALHLSMEDRFPVGPLSSPPGRGGGRTGRCVDRSAVTTRHSRSARAVSVSEVALAADQPERHRTLRAAIGWSYELLDQRERTFLDRMSDFVDGWDEEAAAAAGPVPLDEALPLLAALTEKHVVVSMEEHVDGEPRFRLQDTLK